MNLSQTASIARNRGVTAVLLLLGIIVSGTCATARGQENAATSRKFDEFEDMKTSDIRARLDQFAQQLEKEQITRGVIIGYRQENWPPGFFLRNVYGFRDYLVKLRGIHPEQVSVIDAGLREKTMTELWLVQSGASVPVTPKGATLPLNGLFQFDHLWVGTGCAGEYTMERLEPEDAVMFFAEALRETPTAMGFILVHPSTRAPLRKAVKLAADSKSSLVNQHGVGADRIRTAIESPRNCLEMHFWLAPSRLMVRKSSSVEAFFQSELMAEAEREHYTLRLVGFSGNQYTRDQVLRRRIPGLQEGEIFTKGRLQQNLASLSRLKRIKPVGLEDVEVQLDRKEKTIDLWIHVVERRSLR